MGIRLIPIPIHVVSHSHSHDWFNFFSHSHGVPVGFPFLLGIPFPRPSLLATVNRSRVSIRSRPCKITHTSSLHTMRNLVVVSHTVCTHVGGTKNLGDAEAPLEWRRGWPLETCFSCTCYHAKFGHCRSKHTSLIMEIRQKIRSPRTFQGHSRSAEPTRIDGFLLDPS